MKILQFPLAKISFGFILGILLFPMLKIEPKNSFIILFIGLFVLLGLQLIKKYTAAFKTLFGVFTFMTSISLGVTTATIHKQTFNPKHYIHQSSDENQNLNYIVLLDEKLKNTKKNYRYIVKIKTIQNQESFGKLIVNFPIESNFKPMKIGDILSLNGSFYGNKSPFNPNQFDYGKYLENQEIYGQIYAKNESVELVGYENSIWIFFSNYREKIIDVFQKSNLGKEELTVFIALLLGQQQDISPEILKDYQFAGAVHILSVSGLHVGLILGFINFILRYIPNSIKGKTTKLLIIILSLWSFAIIAGLSPSVVRSVTMFSFLAIGTNLRRTVNIYHTLLVSMFLILLIKPSFLFDVGFQLSYLALFFIVWVDPLYDKIWMPKNSLVNYFWKIICMSTSAQIGAMPLSIFYFHQFPGLFFLTNILIIPLLSVVMAIGVFSLLFACFGFVPMLIIKPLEWSIWLLNAIIHWVASFESFVIKNISFSEPMLWISYFVILSWILWFKKSTFTRLLFGLLSIVLLQFAFIYQKKETQIANEAIVFNSKKNTILTERIGENVTIYSNDSILESVTKNSAIQSYLVGNFCKIKEKKTIENLLYINNKKVLLLDSSSIYTPNIKPDILVITQSPKINLNRLLQTHKPKVIVADGSNFKSYSKLWEATCRKEKILFHNTHEKGFYKF
ncbi:ComEC/Rec2 family competence protein [Flavobacterium dankookense]|uniref:Competence protein ComEC n=1 Tax=Flavobacterium dankookense TaxID=706186 RepID=A0A4R6Q9U8_9FLAO|nr:ComEC/Rec2 family competence protein [Flavobacterium dankookense]TDP58656.1 competence protein ComEC [Flavobacterium dankookense]